MLVFQFSLLPVWMRRCLYSLQLITILSQERHGSWSQSSSLWSYLLPEAGDSPQTIQQNRLLVFSCLLITKIQYIQPLQSHQSVSVGGVTIWGVRGKQEWRKHDPLWSPAHHQTRQSTAQSHRLCPVGQSVIHIVGAESSPFLHSLQLTCCLLYSRVLKQYWCPFIISNNYKQKNEYLYSTF